MAYVNLFGEYFSGSWIGSVDDAGASLTMLFNGEAIFGVVDAAGGGIAAQRAQEIARRSTALGAVAQVHSVGDASLGVVRLKGLAAKSKVTCQSRPITAVACGELIDRRDSGTLYRLEPERSAFLEGGFSSDGEAFLERVDGTFAAAIWNQSAQQMTLICDWRADCRMYYAVEGDQFVFSSWLQLLGGRSRKIDPQSVAEFLRFLYVAPPQTIYTGISSVEPEHYIAARQGMVQSRRLTRGCDWSSTKPANSQKNENEVDQFQFLFERAVARRIGDRCAGVFLSSGVDSAAIMAACAKLNPGRVKAFTIGFDNVDLDETNAARSLANQLGIEHHELRFDLHQYRESFDRVVSGFDQPFGDPAGLPLLLASDVIAGNVDVITGGTGGDDLFGAPIPRHLWFSKVIAARLPPFARRQSAQLFGLCGKGRLFDFEDLQELFVTWPGWTKGELSELFGKSISFDGSGFYRKFFAYRNRDAQTLFDAMGVFPPDDC
ncbi:MAG TPA: asparagine synthetase B family protein, partial [Candidatus Binatus sp.]|nr:asparagine synthetase B family protein [Candidatus Binatus sp.]